MYVGMLAAVLFAHATARAGQRFRVAHRDIPAALVAGDVIVLVGIIDDRWGLDALTKFVGQVTAAGVLVVMGVSWFVHLPARSTAPPWCSTSCRPVWSPSDHRHHRQRDELRRRPRRAGRRPRPDLRGRDLRVLGRSAHEQGGDVGAYPPALIAAALAGACLGFLPHNFQPARIFMGDSGSMLIGLMLAAISTSASGRIPLQRLRPTRHLLGLLSPLLLVGAVMFIPMLDLLLAVVRRTRAGRQSLQPGQDASASPTAPDRTFAPAGGPADLLMGRRPRVRRGRVLPDGPAHRRPAGGRRPGVRAGRAPRSRRCVVGVRRPTGRESWPAR